jgi:hypothetical protein
MYSGKYCNTDGIRVVKELGLRALVIDRYSKELNYDYMLVLRETLGDHLAGVIINDIPPNFMDETQTLIAPFLERRGIKVLGVIPKDPLMGAIKVSDLAERLGGKVIASHHKADRIVESFLIGTMQVENFMTHFRKHKNSPSSSAATAPTSSSWPWRATAPAWCSPATFIPTTSS